MKKIFLVTYLVLTVFAFSEEKDNCVNIDKENNCVNIDKECDDSCVSIDKEYNSSCDEKNEKCEADDYLKKDEFDNNMIQNDKKNECKSSISYGQGHSMKNMTAGYNKPARYDVKCSWDFYISGSFIYWQAKQKGLDYINYQYEEDLEGFITKEHFDTINFDFDPGFKVGLGMNSRMDDWYLYLEYTRHTSSEGKETRIDALKLVTDSENLIWDFGSFIDSLGVESDVLSADGHWKQYLNLLDLELGRAYYVGTKLTFKPFVGGRLGWIDQKYKIKYITDTSNRVNIDCKSDSWLLGPRMGIDTNWLLGEGFRLFGNFAFSVFYQDFDVKAKDSLPVQDGVATAREISIKKERGYIIPNVETAVGFGWGCYFFDKEWHFDASIGYEFHYFWQQNMISNVVLSSIAAGLGHTDDLSYNGLTISLQLDF